MIVYCHIGEYDTYNKVMEVDIKMNKLIFVLLLLVSQSVIAENKNLSLVCDGVKTITQYPKLSDTKNKEKLTLIFENGKLNSHPKYDCDWTENKILCKEPNGTGLIRVDRLSGEVYSFKEITIVKDKRYTNEFEGDCVTAKPKF